ncbi:MAG: hypothetical protein SXU28_14350, partial [Pseudomonadota bacterium]|nr:hypothetical protein [Pseudomonadota bacterium]
RAVMEADGNIRYANYQSQEQVIQFLTDNGFGPETYADWFPASSQQPLPKTEAPREFSPADWVSDGVPAGTELARQWYFQHNFHNGDFDLML